MGVPSQLNHDMAKSYADYLVAFKSVKEATTNLDNLCCADCVQTNLERLKTWNDNSYTLNIPEYNKNPFFLAYKSDRYSGILVDGKLLTEEDIANTERQLPNISITTPIGKSCVPY